VPDEPCRKGTAREAASSFSNSIEFWEGVCLPKTHDRTATEKEDGPAGGLKATDRCSPSIEILRRSRCAPFGSRLGWRKHEGETQQLLTPINLRLAGQDSWRNARLSQSPAGPTLVAVSCQAIWNTSRLRHRAWRLPQAAHGRVRTHSAGDPPAGCLRPTRRSRSQPFTHRHGANDICKRPLYPCHFILPPHRHCGGRRWAIRR